VEIYGEPGIGKTRLLDELAEHARDRGMALARGRAGEYERNVPFGLIGEVLDGLSSEGDVLFEAVATGRAAATERYRLYRSVRQVLTAQARPPGLAVLLDDLHHADEGSHELLEQVLLDMPPARLLIAIAYSGHHVPPGLPSALARTRAEVTRLAPDPLTELDIAELLPHLPIRHRRLLRKVSGGNPLYLKALDETDETTLAALADEDRVDPEDMPRRLQALLMTELRSLDHTQRLVAQAAAIAGDPAELDLVIHIAGRPEDEVFHAMDALVALGVIYNAGAHFRFRHPLVRLAAYQSAGPAWRIGAHRRAEEHLRARDGSLSLRAHHLSRAARYGDADATATLAQAATAALETAPNSAAEWVRTALRLRPEHTEAAGRVDLLLLLAKALSRSDRLVESRAILHDVLQLAGPRRWEAVRYCAVADRLLGRLDEARALLESELALPDSADGRGVLAVELAATNVLLGDADRGARHARDAVADGHSSGDRGQVAAGTTLLGMAALQQADVRTARACLSEAVRLVDGLSDAELREHLGILPPLAWLELHLEHYLDGDRHVARGVEIARSSGRTPVLPYLYIVGSAIAERTGRLELAGSILEDAKDASATIGSSETMAMATAVELATTLWRGGPQAAIELAERGRPRSRWWAEETDVAMANVLLLADRPAAAAAHILVYLGNEPRGSGLTSAHWYSSLALARLALGSREEALDLSEHALQLADTLDLPYHRGIAHLAHARVLAGCGQLPLSVDEAEVAASWFGRARAPLHTAMAHNLAAESLAAAGDLQRARVEFGRAKSGYSACQASWLSARVRNSESRLGARTPRPRRQNAVGTVEMLSSREREIAHLVADGLTNREIAAQLFLSVKTVEAHLARVFTKLGVKSRVGVAQRMSASQPRTAS
jgi:DNA-binding CsgD family transcriptional regulator